jgi:hypothetical protein
MSIKKLFKMENYSAKRTRLSVAKIASISLLFLLVFPCLGTQSKYNYGEALQKTILFYEAQQSGQLPTWNRVPWRGNATLTDGADVGVDLTGGWFDAGDHVKFGFPMAASATNLAWGGIEYYDAYQKSGQLTYLARNLKWVSDYFLKAFVNDQPGKYVFYGQVGDANQDHQWWGPAEVVSYQMARPAYKIDTSCPGSDLAGETSAALSAASIFFRKNGETAYADLLVQKAERLYDFADQYRGKYSDCITAAVPFYTSFSGYQDEIVWGAIWLHKAKGAQNWGYNGEYLTKAIAEYQLMSKPYNYTHITDDKSYGTYVLLAQATGESEYRQHAEAWLDYWTIGYQGEKITYTPGGLAFLNQWGSLNYAANTAFIGFIYSDWLRHHGEREKANRYFDFGVSQVNYILGNNPSNRSYIIGFGKNYPKNPHHRTAHGSWLNDSNNPTETRNLLVGALVGGPDENDQWEDDRNDWEGNEVAIGYNWGIAGALARMYLEFGGEPLTEIPIATDPEESIYVEAKIKQSGANFLEIQADIVNKSASPAKALENAAIRFFFTLDSDDINDISIVGTENECSNPPSQPVQVSDQVYYVEINCQGKAIYPGGHNQYKKSVSFRITSNNRWNDNNDWSIKGLKYNFGRTVKATQIGLYNNGELIWGKVPN